MYSCSSNRDKDERVGSERHERRTKLILNVQHHFGGWIGDCYGVSAIENNNKL